MLTHLVKDGTLELDVTNEITRETLMTRGGEVVHAKMRDLLGLKPLSDATESETNVD